MYRGAICGAIFISFFLLFQMLIDPKHMILLYEFNIPLLFLEVACFGTILTLSFFELGLSIKRESEKNGEPISNAKIFFSLSLTVVMVWSVAWINMLVS